jgi:hypothetical protein
LIRLVGGKRCRSAASNFRRKNLKPFFRAPSASLNFAVVLNQQCPIVFQFSSISGETYRICPFAAGFLRIFSSMT